MASKLTVEKVNNSNYQTWKYKMELILIKEGVWDVVSEDPPGYLSRGWDRRDDKARATIGLQVEDDIFKYIKKAKYARQSWLILQNIYERPTLSNKISLLKRICNLKMLENDDMEKHIHKMNELVEQLTNVGEELSANLVVAMILRSLPDSYDSLVTVLENLAEKDLTVGLVVVKLIDEYKKRLESKSLDETGLESSIMKISSIGYKPKLCMYCEKPGHLKVNCFALKKDLEKQKELDNQKSILNQSANLILNEADDYEFLF